MNIVSGLIGDFLRKINAGILEVPVPMILVHPNSQFATLTWWGDKGFFRIDAIPTKFQFCFGVFKKDISYSLPRTVDLNNSIDGKEKEIFTIIEYGLKCIGVDVTKT